MDSSWLPQKAKLSDSQRARMIDVLNQRNDANPPIPHVEPSRIRELRQLIEAGDEYLAYQEYLHIAQVARGRAIATAMNHAPKPANCTTKATCPAVDGSPAKPVKRKRAALIKELSPIWSSIETDLNDSVRRKLDIAKMAEHGYWDMTKAIQWAIENGRIDTTKGKSQIKSEPRSELSVLLGHLLA